jgi:UDP-glucose 4-epimerase
LVVKVFVTGGAGFIGSTLVDRLLAEDHEVDVVDDLSSGSLANLADARRSAQRRLSFHQLDIRSPDLAELMKRCRPQVVYHLASLRSPRGALGDPVSDAEVNIVGSLRVLEGARVTGAQKVVFATNGAEIYGEADPAELPVKESHPQRPLTPHGVAKKAVVDYLEAYREIHNLEFTALAMSNVYGPRQDPDSEGGVVSRFVARLLSEDVVTVFGDGTQTRDFVYVDDAVDALARSAERGGGLLLNVGTGAETAISELYRLLAARLGVDRPAAVAPARPGEILRSAVDPSRAAIHLGWRPWTTMDDGTAAVIEWLRARRAD